MSEQRRIEAAVPDRPAVYRGFSRAEAAWGLVWLMLGALVSVFLEVVYLGTWIGRVPFPFTIVIAGLGNIVLTRTAALWSDRAPIRLLPLFAWLLGFFVLMVMPAFTADQLLLPSLRTLLLLGAGVAGGVWPLVYRR